MILPSNDFIESLLTRPETYKTILKDLFDNKNTLTNVVRKKVGKMVKFGFITYGVLDGTRFGERIFYRLDKTYFIFIICCSGCFKYYYCFNVYDVDEVKVMLSNAFVLNHCNWDKLGDVYIDKKDIWRWF